MVEVFLPVAIGDADSITVAPWLHAGSSPERALDWAMGHQIERGSILRYRGNEENLVLLTSCSSGSSSRGAMVGFFLSHSMPLTTPSIAPLSSRSAQPVIGLTNSSRQCDACKGMS
jgi:hypothetical protein